MCAAGVWMWSAHHVEWGGVRSGCLDVVASACEVEGCLWWCRQFAMWSGWCVGVGAAIVVLWVLDDMDGGGVSVRGVEGV